MQPQLGTSLSWLSNKLKLHVAQDKCQCDMDDPYLPSFYIEFRREQNGLSI